jgi:hypothetical protein
MQAVDRVHALTGGSPAESPRPRRCVDVARAVVRRWESGRGRARGASSAPTAGRLRRAPGGSISDAAGGRSRRSTSTGSPARPPAPRRGGRTPTDPRARTRNWTDAGSDPQATDRLAVTADRRPKYDDRYWVVDGHRVAAALYGGQIRIDASVAIWSPGEVASESAANLASVLTGSQALRTAGRGRRVGNLSHEDRIDEAPESS